MTVSSRLIRHTELGIEQQCPTCRDWWPADTEFFHASPEGALGLRSICKVCSLINDAVRKGRVPPPPPPVPQIFTLLLRGAA